MFAGINRLYKQCAAPVLAAAILILSACDSGPKQTVWDMYDVRHPVPAGSNVPVSRAKIAERYYDNDAYYIAPNFGSCGSNNIGLGGCE